MTPIKQTLIPARTRTPFDVGQQAGYRASMKRFGPLLLRLKKLSGLPKAAVKESLPLPKAVRASPVTS